MLNNYDLASNFKYLTAAPVQEKLKKTRTTLNVDELNNEDLLALRDKIDEKLGGVDLKDVNIVSEMVLQLKKARILQDEVSEDEDVPANQRAQVQNSLAAIISSLDKLQNATFTSEKLKRMEGTLIRVMKRQPKEIQEAFFDEYVTEAENDGL